MADTVCAAERLRASHAFQVAKSARGGTLGVNAGLEARRQFLLGLGRVVEPTDPQLGNRFDQQFGVWVEGW